MSAVNVDDDDNLAKLRRRWQDITEPRWHIWRSTRLIDGEQVPNAWCATRLHEQAGPDMTVMADTALRLEELLVEQATLAASGAESLTPALDL